MCELSVGIAVKVSRSTSISHYFTKHVHVFLVTPAPTSIMWSTYVYNVVNLRLECGHSLRCFNDVSRYSGGRTYKSVMFEFHEVLQINNLKLHVHVQILV